jgi:hypothetical protein
MNRNYADQRIEPTIRFASGRSRNIPHDILNQIDSYVQSLPEQAAFRGVVPQSRPDHRNVIFGPRQNYIVPRAELARHEQRYIGDRTPYRADEQGIHQLREFGFILPSDRLPPNLDRRNNRDAEANEFDMYQEMMRRAKEEQ